MSTFYQPVHLEIGPDSLEQLPAQIKKYGTKPLLVHGHHPVENGLLEKVRVILNNAGIAHANMGEILPNPKYTSVKRGIEIARKEKCDLILSLGGGSTLQCAKGIAAGVKYKGKLWDVFCGKGKLKKSIPVGAVLTNPASGDELNDVCTLVKDGKQKTLTSPQLICSFAILDPNLAMISMYPTMCECFELFAGLMNRYLEETGAEAQMDLYMMQELKKNTQILEKNLDSVEARNCLFWISTMVHALHQPHDNSLSENARKIAFHNSLATGAALSALFMNWAKEKAAAKPDAFKAVGESVFGLSDCSEQSALDALLNMIHEMQLPDSLSSTGLNFSAQNQKSSK